MVYMFIEFCDGKMPPESFLNPEGLHAYRNCVTGKCPRHRY